MPDAKTPAPKHTPEHEVPGNGGRRGFLKTLGKAAIITPPAMTILLSTSLDSPAIATSGGKHPHGKGKGYGYGYGKGKRKGKGHF